MYNNAEFINERNETRPTRARRSFGCNQCENEEAEVRTQPRCTCIDREELLKCTQRKIFMYLGNYAYDLLENLDLPCCHPSLNCSLLALASGRELPCNHPSLEKLLCKALREEREEEREDECTMPWLWEEGCRRCQNECGCRRCPGEGCGCRRCQNECGCNQQNRCNRQDVTPRQLEGIKMYLGCKVFCYLKRLDLPCDHASLECSVLALAYGEELPCGHQPLNRLLARALDCGKCPCPCK